ncbi:response regulator [Spongiimicrobium salis]|uniref:response regulator n=1 Tax=Spongiimicrobium salis TaxID=1667022 RepID=UPI00374DF5CD
MLKTDKYNIWIIEDDTFFRTSLEDLVGDEDDFELSCSFGAVEEGIAAFKGKKKPDVILHDIGLPGMSGIESVPIMKEQFPEVAIIMLTIFDDDERVFDAIKAGADGYLLKRTSGEDLIKGIWEVLKGGAPISPSIAKKMMRMLVPPTERSKKEEILTKRETTILKHLVAGMTIDQIGETLFISRHTVDTHTKNIYKKLQVHNRSSLTAKAIKKRLI